jgi:hypothetical protein
MFELNLIRDKARARRRRRIIFLSIVSIMFFSLLNVLFIGSLWFSVAKETDREKLKADSKEKEAKELKAFLDVEQPKWEKNRNQVIRAWNETDKLFTTRRTVTPSLKDLMSNTARVEGNVQFWYTELRVAPVPPSTQGGPGMIKTSIIEPLQLYATGVIQVTESDDRTRILLGIVSDRLASGNFGLGVPSFEVDFSKQLKAPGGGEGSRYAEFTLRTTQVSSGLSN